MQEEGKKRFDEMHVLLFEEDDLLRGYHKALLERLGITCESAADYAQDERVLKEAGVSGRCADICFVSRKQLGDGRLAQLIHEADGAEHMQVICLVKEKEADYEGIRAAGADGILVFPIDQAEMYHFMKELQKRDV